MSLKICEKCGEEVDESKAFCPDCGNPFVEEQKREESSEFDKYAGTVNFSQSVYKMMLSEMDLDTSKKSDQVIKPEQPKQEIKEPNPLEQEAEREQPKQIPVQNITPKKKLPEQKTIDQPVKKKNSAKWIIFAVFGLAIFAILALAILAALYFYFS